MIPATNEHVWGEWTTANGVHTRTCTTDGCSAADFGNCDYDVVVVDPTCCADGSTTKTCKVCGDVITEVIPATNEHVWGEWTTADGVHTRACTNDECTATEEGNCDYDVVVTAPTCCTAGYTTKTCKVCGDIVVTDNVPATNEHAWGEWTVETPATTTTPGVEKRVCTNDECTAFETRAINILSNIALTVEGVEDAKAGDTVTVTVGVTGNTGFAGATLEITYAEGLTPVATETSGLFGVFTGITEETDLSNNTFRVSFLSATNVAADGAVFTITFKVADDAEAGDYAVEAAVVEAVYETEDNIDLAGAAGKVTVVEDAPEALLGDVNNDGKVTSSDVVTLMMVVNGAVVENYNALNADVNEDGNITSSDIVALMMKING